MADQRSPLKEFRHLDEKLRTVGLSAQERARWEQLRDLVSAAAPLRPGFDVKAAAAELKASLEPAGLRRPAAPPAPAPVAAEEPEAVAISDVDLEPEEPAAAWPQSALAAEGGAPSWEGQAGDAGAQAWDAPPPAEAAAWDPGAQALDAGSQPYDPNAQAWDAAQPADGVQPTDGAAPAWDAAPAEAATWDPAVQALDAGAQPYDPNAQAWDAAQPADGFQPADGTTPAWEAAPAEATAWDPAAQALDAGGQPYDPNAQAWDTAQPAGGVQPTEGAAPAWEAAPAAAWDPAAQAPDAGGQPYDPNAQAWDTAQPADGVQPAEGAAPAWEAAPAEPAAWDPGAQALDAGAQPYDPNAQPWDAAQPTDGAAPAWEAAPEAQPAASPDLAAAGAEATIPASHDASAFAATALDFSGGELTPEGAEALDSPALAPPGGQAADAGAWVEPQPEPQPEPAVEPGPWAPDEGAAAEGLAFAPSQDPSEAVPPPAVEDAPPLEMATAADFLDLAAAAQAAPSPGAGESATDLDQIEVEEIPTVDAEEILEEPPPAPAAPVSASYVAGEHRVVVHTVEGQVIRGTISDVDLDSAEVPLLESGGVQLVPSSRIKAIFFMLLPGGKPPPPEGHRVRVTFRDGRQVAGFCADYDESRSGFFMVPADTRTNTGRIWVYRSATRQVSVT